MADESLDFLLKTAGREYLRARLDLVIRECFETANPEPIHKFIQKLVLAGPSTLELLQEIEAEVHLRRDQVRDDLHQVLDGLRENLLSQGIQVSEERQIRLLTKGKPEKIQKLLHAQGIVDRCIQNECMQLLRDSHELVKTLDLRLHLLDEMDIYVEDWMWGLYYQSIRPVGTHPKKSRYH